MKYILALIITISLSTSASAHLLEGEDKTNYDDVVKIIKKKGITSVMEGIYYISRLALAVKTKHGEFIKTDDYYLTKLDHVKKDKFMIESVVLTVPITAESLRDMRWARAIKYCNIPTTRAAIDHGGTFGTEFMLGKDIIYKAKINKETCQGVDEILSEGTTKENIKPKHNYEYIL